MPEKPDFTTEQDALNQVKKFVTETESLNETQKENLVEFFEMYSLKDRRRDIEPWLSDLQINGAFEFVERAFSAMVSNTPSFELEETTPDAPKIELEPEILDDAKLGGDGFTVLRESVTVPFKEVYEQDLMAMFKKRNMKKFLRTYIKGALIYGTYGAEITQDTIMAEDFSELTEKEEVEEGTNIKEIIEKIVPEVSPIEPFDILVSPFANTIEEAINFYGGFGVIRNDLTLRDLDKDVYFNLDDLELSLNPTQPNEQDKQDEKRQKEQIVSQSQDDQGQIGSFNLIELWTWFGEPGDQKKVVIGVVNNTVIRFEEVDDDVEIPFVILKDQEVPGQFWGIGEVEPIKPDLVEENTLKNQRIDFNNRALNEEWLVRSDAGVDVTQLVSKPHNVIVGDDIGPSAIREVVRNPATVASSGEDIDRLRRNMSAVNGSIAIESTGNIGGVTNTATGEIIRQQTATARYAAKIENVEFAVAEIAKKMLIIKANALEEGEKIPVFLRGKWREVDAKLYKEYIEKYIVRVRSGSMNIRNSIRERNDRIAAVNVGLQAAQALGPDAVNMAELYRPLLQSFPDLDIDKVLPRRLPEPTQNLNIQAQVDQLPPVAGPAPQEGPNEQPGLPNAQSLDRIT